MKKNVGNIMRKISAALNNNKAKNNDMEEDTMMENLTTKNNDAGAGTMTNENSRNMDGTRAMEAVPSGNPVGAIPEDGQAVTGSPCECTSLMVQENTLPQKEENPATGITATTEFAGDMDGHDRAVETKVPYDRKCTALNKEVRRITDGRSRVLCAWVSEDENNNKHITVVQQYRDGTYSPEIKIKRSDIVMASMAVDDEIQKRTKKFLIKTWEEYYNKFNGQPDELMKMQDIVGMLGSELGNLPVYEDGLAEVERLEFHKKVLESARSLTTQAFNDHDAYYPLSGEDIVDVARDLGLDKMGLLKRLQKYNLLYTTPSTRGLQTNVRITQSGSESYVARRYCVFRNAEIENNEEYAGYDF